MDTVQLNGGLIVSRQALELAIDLEFRGVVLTVKESELIASPGQALTDEDIAAIKANKWHLMAISTYESPRPDWV